MKNKKVIMEKSPITAVSLGVLPSIVEMKQSLEVIKKRRGLSNAVSQNDTKKEPTNA